MDRSEFDILMNACAEVADAYRDGVAFIGGIAVYMHSINNTSTAMLAETTHDADFYISMADMSDLRDQEEITPNRRLSKHQMIRHGFEFDIYTERQSSLIVPYDAVMANANIFDGIRVASLPHLLALKIEAYRDRRASVKGLKDAKDIYRIALVGAKTTFDWQLAAPFLTDEHSRLLSEIVSGTAAISLAQGNAMTAKQYRNILSGLLDERHAPNEAPSTIVNSTPSNDAGPNF